jgi:hypothetical protein
MEGAGDSPDDRVQDQVARSAIVKKYVASLWPVLDAKAVLHTLLSDADELARHSRDLLSDEERRILLWDNPPRSKGTVRWSRPDTVLLDELGDHIARTPSLGHVVLDEAQDLSPMQLRALGRRCSTGSATVLGDIAQGTTPWATDSWESSLHHLGKPGSHVEVLDRGFRVPASVIEYAAQLLPHMAPGLGAPVSVRDNPGRLDLVPVAPSDLLGRTADVVALELAEPGSIGVIAPDDRVVVVEPAAIAAAEPDQRTGLRRLYVVLTRAVSALTVVHAEPLPVELGSP